MLALRVFPAWFLLVSLTVLFVGAAARADDGKAALQLVSENTSLVVSVNVERLRTSPLYAELWRALDASPDLADALKQLKDGAGFELERDLSTLLLSTPPDVERSQDYLLIAQGQFDRARFLSFAQSKGADYKERIHEGVSFYEVGSLAALGFIDSYLVLGTPSSLRTAVDTLRGNKPKLQDAAALAKLVGDVDVAKDLWFVFAFPPALRADLAEATKLPMIGQVSALLGSVDLQVGLSLRLHIRTDSPAAAAEIAAFINALLKQFSTRPQLKALGLSAALIGSRVAASGAEVSVAFDLSQDESAALKTLLLSSTPGNHDDPPPAP